MKKRYLTILLFPLVTGCLSPAPRAPEQWCIEYRAVKGAKAGGTALAKHPEWAKGVVRIEAVSVRPPYSGERIAVARPDGTIAFDAFNTFASLPGSLMRGAVYDAVSAAGLFANVVPPISSARADYLMEVGVSELMIDCRQEGRRTARVALMVTLLRGRETLACVCGQGAAEAGENFSSAFSSAFSQAMEEALEHL